MKPTLIRFDDTMLARLQRFADSRGISVARLVRMIVEDFFQRKEAEAREGPKN